MHDWKICFPLGPGFLAGATCFFQGSVNKLGSVKPSEAQSISHQWNLVMIIVTRWCDVYPTLEQKKKLSGKLTIFFQATKKNELFTDSMKYGLSKNTGFLQLTYLAFISGPKLPAKKPDDVKWTNLEVQQNNVSWNGDPEKSPVASIQIYPDGKWLSICKSGTFLSDFYYYWMLQHNPSAKCGD